jgi:hypothetical protein
MASLRAFVSQLQLLAARATVAAPRVAQLLGYAAIGPPTAPRAYVSQALVLAAFGPPQSRSARDSQALLQIARSGEGNVSVLSSQALLLIAYGSGVPGTPRTDAWTYTLDGHRMWVLPLGLEGDWQYDTITKQWSQLQTQGFVGLNFTHGVQWKSRIMGGDALYGFLYELDPNQVDDEDFRPVEHIVTGGIQTRSPNQIGVANFRMAASIGYQSDSPVDVILQFSDDNGNTWSDPNAFIITINEGVYNTALVWDALGSFQAPGRIFRVTDYGGFLSISGADAALNNYDEDDNAASGGGGSSGS